MNHKHPHFYSLLLCSLLIVSVTSCVTTLPTKESPEATPDKVLSRIDDMSSRPTWLKESEPFQIKGSEVTSLGETTIPSDHRVEAAYRIAENNAKKAIANAIEQRLEFIFQNAEEGTEMDTTQARFIGAEASELVTSSLRPGKRYWEKVATTKDSGERVTMIKVFATVTMPEAAFKKAVEAAVKKAEGSKGLSSSFSKKVDDHWDQFTKGGNDKPAQGG